MLKKIFLYGLFFFIPNLYATTLVLSGNETIVGKVRHTYSLIGESIDEVGRRFNIGYYEMVHANPTVDPVHILAAKTSLIIPSQFIIPLVPRKGIVINLAEYRLYYFVPNENVVLTFPVGIGREGWNTPVGITKISAKVNNPTWKPTKNLRAAAEEIGAMIPESFPPGPNNPLGKQVLRLEWPTFLIHGTNRSDGIGARVSAGCIRMLPDDMEELFNQVPIGTSVRIINQPVKIGMQNGRYFLQIYPVLQEKKLKLVDILLAELKRFKLDYHKNNKIIATEITQPSGLIRQLIA